MTPQQAIYALQDAVEQTVRAGCYREDVLAEVERAWEWFEAEAKAQSDERETDV